MTRPALAFAIGLALAFLSGVTVTGSVTPAFALAQLP